MLFLFILYFYADFFVDSILVETPCDYTQEWTVIILISLQAKQK